MFGTRCDLGSSPGLDRLRFMLEASRLVKYLTVIPDVKLKSLIDYCCK